MNKLIAIQGAKGSFHHIATMEYYNGDASVLECMTFDETVSCVLTNKCHAAVMAIENSIAGSILPNYALIDNNKLNINGETYLDIQHNLMCLRGQSIDDIKEVYSHPMALLQCKTFFKDYPNIKLVEDKDTAEVARRIKNKELKGIAAIASTMASELFDLEILASSIQTIQHNETRFVIVSRENGELPKDEINKASVKFDVEHKRGSLATVLNVISDCNLNLTKIQSLPKIETPWKYEFFVDLTFNDYKNFDKSKTILSLMAENFKILGEYKNAKV